MFKLTKISLEGYKSVRECRDLRLERLNVLIGGNGSGKSNFLSFFRLLYFAMGQTLGALQEFVGRSGGANSLLYFGAKTTPHLCAALEFASDPSIDTYRLRLAHAAPDDLIFAEESILSQPTGTRASFSPESLGVGHRESALLLPEHARHPAVSLFLNALRRSPGIFHAALAGAIDDSGRK